MASRLLAAIQEALPETKVTVGGQGVVEEEMRRIPAGVLVAGPDTLAVLDDLAAGRGVGTG